MKKLLLFTLLFLCLCSIIYAKEKNKQNVVKENKTELKKEINKESADMKTVYDFLKKCKTYYLATIENDQPRVRPFGTIDLFENKLYIQTGKVKNVSKQIEANPNVEICSFLDGKWLRLEGKVIRDDRREAKKSMLDANPVLRGMYSEDDDNTEVLYFENAKATFYSFTEQPKIVEF